MSEAFMSKGACCLMVLLCWPAMALGAPTGASDGAGSHVLGKPNAGFRLASEHTYQVVVGKVQPVTVVLESEAQQGQVRVTVAASEPQLELLSPVVQTWDLSDGTAPTLELELLPHQNGRYYVMLTVELAAEGAPPRAQSLGFVVQAGKPERTTTTAKSAVAPAVVTLPVQETVRTQK